MHFHLHAIVRAHNTIYAIHQTRSVEHVPAQKTVSKSIFVRSVTILMTIAYNKVFIIFCKIHILLTEKREINIAKKLATEETTCKIVIHQMASYST